MQERRLRIAIPGLGDPVVARYRQRSVDELVKMSQVCLSPAPSMDAVQFDGICWEWIADFTSMYDATIKVPRTALEEGDIVVRVHPAPLPRHVPPGLADTEMQQFTFPHRYVAMTGGYVPVSRSSVPVCLDARSTRHSPESFAEFALMLRMRGWLALDDTIEVMQKGRGYFRYLMRPAAVRDIANVQLAEVQRLYGEEMGLEQHYGSGRLHPSVMPASMLADEMQTIVKPVTMRGRSLLRRMYGKNH